jgi:uncharacterized membrane protein (DUF2068 family)
MHNYSNNVQPSYYSSSPPPVPKKERGALFTLALGASTLWSFFTTMLSVMGGAWVQQKLAAGATEATTQGASHVVSRLIVVLAVFQIVQLISVCGMWAWKRWAVMGFFATSLMSALGVMKMTGETPMLAFGWMGLMLVCVFPRIGMFED